MSKIFVQVEVKFDLEGTMTPTSIQWEDGRKFEIDRILDVRRAASLKAGGQGIRFTIRIQGNQRYLYFDEPLWFVEGKEEYIVPF